MSFIIDPYRYVGCPAEALAFIAAAGITDATQKQAICTLVSDLKAFGIYNKMIAIYPFCGSTSTQQKYNLKDPRDLDAAFRLVFFGGWTFSTNGALPNGVNAYADTFLTPSISLSISSAHFSKYNRNNDLVGVQKVDGCAAAAGANYMQQNYVSANGVIGEVGAVISYTQTDTRGLFTINRTATNSQKLFRNNSTIGTSTFTISNIPNVNFYLGARNDNGVTTSYNSYECAFASIGDGLTDTEAANLYTAVQKYQTTLGRQV